jgi:hypothetical protein
MASTLADAGGHSGTPSPPLVAASAPQSARDVVADIQSLPDQSADAASEFGGIFVFEDPAAGARVRELRFVALDSRLDIELGSFMLVETQTLFDGEVHVQPPELVLDAANLETFASVPRARLVETDAGLAWPAAERIARSGEWAIGIEPLGLTLVGTPPTDGPWIIHVPAERTAGRVQIVDERDVPFRPRQLVTASLLRLDGAPAATMGRPRFLASRPVVELPEDGWLDLAVAPGALVRVSAGTPGPEEAQFDFGERLVHRWTIEPTGLVRIEVRGQSESMRFRLVAVSPDGSCHDLGALADAHERFLHLPKALAALEVHSPDGDVVWRGVLPTDDWRLVIDLDDDAPR